jgi:hypothetical protein
MKTPASSITFDDSHWPLLIIRFVGTPTLEQFDLYLRRRASYLLRGEPHVSISDVRASTIFATEFRQRTAVWLQEHGPIFERTVVGTAIVITSPILRLMVSTLLRLRPQSVPYALVATTESGARWCADQLEETGFITTSERIREQFSQYRMRASG